MTGWYVALLFCLVFGLFTLDFAVSNQKRRIELLERQIDELQRCVSVRPCSLTMRPQ